MGVDVEVALFEMAHLDGVLSLCAAQGWPTFPSDPDRAMRVLRAPGAVTVVALGDPLGDYGEVVGFAHALTDGGSAYLAQVLVAPAHRRRGMGRALVSEVFRRCGTGRMDVLTNPAQSFYQAQCHRRYAGFRLYPSP